MKKLMTRRSAKSAGHWPAPKKILRYDRHGDLVDDDIDDAYGATVVPSESRWLAQPALDRRVS